MSTTNRCAYLNARHEFEMIQEEIVKPGDNQVLVKIMVNGICGSDIHFFHEGRLGNFVVTVPYIPGHEASGIIEEAGKDVKGLKPGDHVVVEPGIPCGICRFCRDFVYIDTSRWLCRAGRLAGWQCS